MLQNAHSFLKRRQNVLHVFKSKIFLTEKQIEGKGRPGMRARIAKVSDRSPSQEFAHVVNVAKISDRTRITISTPKQMLQILAIALGQVKAGNTSRNLMKSVKRYIVCNCRNY